MTIDEINALFDAAAREETGFVEPSPEDLAELETLFPDSGWEFRCS